MTSIKANIKYIYQENKFKCEIKCPYLIIYSYKLTFAWL